MTQLDWQRASADEDEEAGAYLEVAAGPDGQICMRESNDPETVVVTTQARWDHVPQGGQGRGVRRLRGGGRGEPQGRADAVEGSRRRRSVGGLEGSATDRCPAVTCRDTQSDHKKIQFNPYAHRPALPP